MLNTANVKHLPTLIYDLCTVHVHLKLTCLVNSFELPEQNLLKFWILLNCHTRLHLGSSAKLRIWHVPACKMEPQRGIILRKPPTHPPPAGHLFLTDPMTTGSLFWCAVFPPPLLAPCSESMCGVPPPYWYPVKKICAVSPPSRNTLFLCSVPSPQFSSVPWTLWLCLGFWANLRI